MTSSPEACGYTENQENLPEGIPAVSCEEPVWGDEERCIWHSEVDNKPTGELEREWETAPTRIDGLYLSESQVGDRIDFESKILYAADFSGSDLTEADFRDADLDFADFSNTILRSARFDTEDTILTNANFKEAKCKDTRFQRATLHNSHFELAIANSVKMQHVDAADADFSKSVFHDAKLIDANLRSTEFTGAELHQAECGRVNLESACLKGADLRGSSLVDANLYNTDLRDAEIDHETDFGIKIFREFIADNESEGDIATKLTSPPQNTELDRGSHGTDYTDESKYNSNWNSYEKRLRSHHKFVRGVSRLIHRIPGQSSKKSAKLLEESEEIYSNIKQLCRSNPVPQKQRHFNIREKEVKRKRAYSSGSLSWFRWSSLRWSMLYGESAKHVIISALVTVLICAILYPIFGVQTVGNRIVEYSISGTISVTYTLDILFFSLRRLISTSNGGYVPIGVSEWIALIQTTIGALLVAMLVFTLGRRATT